MRYLIVQALLEWIRRSAQLCTAFAPLGHELAGRTNVSVLAAKGGCASRGKIRSWHQQWDFRISLKRTSQPGNQIDSSAVLYRKVCSCLRCGIVQRGTGIRTVTGIPG